MKKEYALKKALPGPEQSVMFKGNRITLGIPRKGEVICNEWKVFPAIPPKVILLFCTLGSRPPKKI